jgi:hypothetical protein
MADIGRRQFVASLAAATACAAAAGLPLADSPSSYENGLLLLATNRSRITEIRPGWLRIIAIALEKMSAIDPDLEIRQIKQKFGGLRIYYNSERRQQLQPAVEEAEVLCGKTCEECGKPGTLFSQDGFVRTLCQEHRGERISVC